MESTIATWVLAQAGISGLVLLITIVALFNLWRDLAKLRTELQQQVAHDLLNKRFAAYDQLWTALKPLAIYSNEPFTPAGAAELSQALSTWYFSPAGGMYLTVRARDFYFALQDSLRIVSSLKGWACTERPDDPKDIFRLFVRENSTFNPAGLDRPENIKHEDWRDVCKSLAKKLEADTPNRNHRVFALVQQLSSALRTVLSYDLRTRLDVNVPRL